MTTAYQSILRPPSPNGGAEESFDLTGASSRLSPTHQLSSPTTSSSSTHNRHFIIDSAKSSVSSSFSSSSCSSSSSSCSSSSASSSSSAAAARAAAASSASQSDVPKSMKYTPSYQHYHSRNFSLSSNNPHSSKRSGKTIATPPQSPDLSADAKRRSRSFASSTVSMSSGSTSVASRSSSSVAASAPTQAATAAASASPSKSSSFDLSVDFPYLRATHSFNAQALFQEHNLDESSSVCLSFDESDIAILHSVHTSGWGDATLLSSGVRGWIPTNYFVPYVESQAVPLLAAILTFVINPRSHEVKNQGSTTTATAALDDIQKTPTASSPLDKTVNYTFSQTSITNIVAGVRSLLEMCGTLTRDSPIVRRSPSIRKFRKGLLTELAILVSLAKQHKNSTDGIIIEKLLQGCYKIVTKTVIFLDVWAIETDAKSKLDDDEPPSPSKQLHDSVLEHQRITELREHKLQHAASSESVSSPQKRRSHGNARSKASQRESVIFHTEPPFASQRLDEVHEALTTYLGIFIHRMSILETDPTASSQILLNTRKSMLASRELLASVEAISTASRPRSRELEKSKDNLYAQIRSLVHIAREVASASLEDFENANEPSSKRHDGYEKLVNIAVDCARSAGECVVRCRNMLQQMGDFQLRDNREYPDFSDGLIAVDDSTSRSSSGSSSTYCENDDNDDNGDGDDGNETIEAEINENASNVASSPSRMTDSSRNSLSQYDSEEQHKQVKSSPSRVFDTLKDYNTEIGPKSPPTPTRVYDDDQVNSLLPRIPHLSPLRTDKDSPTDNNSDAAVELGESRIEEVVYDNNNNLRGATVRALVSMLVDEKKTAEVSMTSSFFLTFRTFTTAEEVYDILIQQFEPERQLSDIPIAELENFSAKRLKIFNFFTRWMESHWRQSSDGVILSRLLEFADTHFSSVTPNGDKIIHTYARDLMSGELNDGEPIIKRPIELENEAEFYSQRKQGNQTVGKKVGSTISISLSKTQLHQLQKYHEMATRDSNDEVVEEASRSLMNVSTWASSIRKGSHNTSSLSANSSSVHLPGVDGQQASQQASNLLSILDFDAMDIAHQLTQIDSELFKAIEPNELINQNFALKKRGLGLAPHVAELSAYSNQLSSFVGDSILGGVESGSGINTKTRTKLLKQWIKIADRCHELGNFNTTLSIVSAMQSVNILRLKKIWETLSAKYHTMFQNLKYVLDPNKNFSGYRNKLKSQPLPVIPYLGLYLSDLTFVEEGNPKFRRPSANASNDQPKIINVDRYERTTRLVAELQRYQQVSYSLIPSKELQFWLRSEMAKSHALVVRDQQGLWRRSCIVEPKA